MNESSLSNSDEYNNDSNINNENIVESLPLYNENKIEILPSNNEIINEITPLQRITIYKERKYFWKSKCNVHIHIFEFTSNNCIELVVYNTETCIEAPRMYLSLSTCNSFVSEEKYNEQFDPIRTELIKWKINKLPTHDELSFWIKKSMLCNHIIDHLVIQTKPKFMIKLEFPDNQIIGNLCIDKPSDINETIIKRFGKAADLIGEAENDDLNDSNYSLSTSILYALSKISKKSLKPSRPSAYIPSNRLSTVSRKSKANVKKVSPFLKLRNDEDLYIESLSFLDIYEIMTLQVVCKRWKRVLHLLFVSLQSIVIKPKYKVDVIDEIPETLSEISDSSENSTNVPANLVYDTTYYVMPETIKKILFSCSKNVKTLKFDYVVINEEIMQMLSIFRLRYLSVGIVKLHPLCIYEMSTVSDIFLSNPSYNDIRDLTNVASRSPLYWPYINGDVISYILSKCGKRLYTLELSILIGELPDDIFARFAPKLQKLLILDSNIVKPNECFGFDRSNITEGAIDYNGFLSAITDIHIIDLIQLLQNTPTEPMLLLNPLGKIVYGNEIFLQTFEYTNENIYSLDINILYGSLTSYQPIKSISENFAKLRQPVEEYLCLYTSRKVMLMCQLIIIPNAMSYKGEELTYDHITTEFMYELLEKDTENNENDDINVNQYNSQYSLLKYHIVRIGIISNVISPDNECFLK